MSWGTKKFGATDYNLTHLDPIIIGVTPKAQNAPSYSVRVAFGSHCFTRALEHADPADHHFTEGGTTRCFCPQRYAQSHHLPAIVRAAQNGNAFFSKPRNMLIVEQIPGLNGPYAVFFNLRKAKDPSFSVAMFIASAYEKPNLIRALPALPFTVVVATVAQGQQLTPPARKTRW